MCLENLENTATPSLQFIADRSSLQSARIEQQNLIGARRTPLFFVNEVLIDLHADEPTELL